ncbi:unnamed protein product [Urochloa decumbens]|uniref:Uncharacterized protein n=1 Tax=Urochloa decumbens TaxID=240449 RepID=A0ABC9EH99_9POAL
METPVSSSATGDGSSPEALEDDATWESDPKKKIEELLRGDPSYYQMLGYPDATSYYEAKKQRLFSEYLHTVSPKLRPILEKDSLTLFYRLCNGWSHLMGIRHFIYPEILSTMVSKNAVRCARATLQGRAPLCGRRADPNLAAETFSVEMVELLLRHGASANHRTKGEQVIEDLLPLHIAVENASMHKYLEDHWDDGDPLDHLISLLCLPEMKMYLDTTRLIAKHTHNIVDEVWNCIDKNKVVQLAILLLAAHKQLRDPITRINGKVSRNGFESIRHRTYEAVCPLHLQMINMVSEGVKGSGLNKLKQKKEALLRVDALVSIVHKAGEALEEYVKTCSEVHHDKILEHVSSIPNSKGIVPSEKGIDTANLRCYKYPWKTSVDSHIHEIHVKEPPKGFAIKDVRNKFFPYWKSVLSARLEVKIVPPWEPSRKDIQRTKPSKKDIKSTQPSRKGLESAEKSMGNLVSTSRSQLASNYECRRKLCAVASMSLKVFKRA